MPMSPVWGLLGGGVWCMMGTMDDWGGGRAGAGRAERWWVTGDAAGAQDKGGSHTAGAHHTGRSGRRPSTWNRGRGGRVEARTFTGTDACWEVESHAGSLGTQHNRRGSSGAQTTGDKKAPQSPQTSGLRGRSSPEKMSFSFITLTFRLDLPTAALSIICSGL